MKLTQSDVTLGQVLATRENSLNFMRLVFAASVIFGHSWVTGGFGEDQVAAAFPFDISQVNAVDGFFVISGYLIAGSRIRLSFLDFIWRRFVRIFPAFWVCLTVTAFVFAPVLAGIMGWNYSFASGIGYVVRNAALYIFQGGIQDTLVAIPHEIVWNASLWTLFYEFAAYVCAGVLLSVPAVRKHASIVVGSLFLVVLAAQVGLLAAFGAEIDLFWRHALRLAPLFLAGMFIFFVRDKIRLNWLWFLVPVVALLALMLAGQAWRFGQLPFALVVLWIGAKVVVPWGSKHDISYGVYIWAFPIQQILASLGIEPGGAIGTAFLALLLTTPLAWLSWLYVERPTMRLRRPSKRPSGDFAARGSGNSS